MARKPEEHRYQDQEDEHLNLKLSPLINGNPRVNNDLIMKAFNDTSYSTEKFVRPEQGAERFQTSEEKRKTGPKASQRRSHTGPPRRWCPTNTETPSSTH